MDCRAALRAVQDAPTLLEGMRRTDDLVVAAAGERGSDVVDLLRTGVEEAVGRDDWVTAIAAVHALGVVREPAALTALADLVRGGGLLAGHAAWALADADPADDAPTGEGNPGARAALEALQRGGGFDGMLAELTLETWERRADGRDGRALPARPSPPPGRGVTVAQLYLHADVDGNLTHTGQGDTGGIATLLVRLGDALLATDSPVERVVTISRGSAGLPSADELAGPGHHYAGVPLPGPRVRATDAWPLRPVAERGIRAILEAAAPVDVLHLRMADVGSMAAAAAARDLGIPVVLTMAPDPQALIAARDAAGELTRATFGAADATEHLVFRDRLLRRLAEQAEHLVLFPRPAMRAAMRDLLGLDLDDPPARVSVVEEGVDTALLARAAREVGDRELAGPATRAALAELDALLAELPIERRGLPVAVAVGRLNPVKGMATLVRAWAQDPTLADRCTLLVVGGDLEDPDDDERDQLAAIDAVVPREEARSRGLVLAGHRPNATTAVWLAAVRRGRPGLAAAGGVYVSASLKEEFGMSILEAMGSGLPVVAPAAGGPSTYVEEGLTGFLVDTTDEHALARAVHAALDLAIADGAADRAAHAERLVAERYGIAAMAAALAPVYAHVAGHLAPGDPQPPGLPEALDGPEPSGQPGPSDGREPAP